MSRSIGEILFQLLEKQSSEQKAYPLSSRDKRIINAQTLVKTNTGVVDETDDEPLAEENLEIPRESLKTQAGLAEIGAKMGFKIWLPRSDRTSLFSHLNERTKEALLEELPISYDDPTIKTIENIDV